MALTREQRTLNLRRIAEAAVSLEDASGIPAELCTVQCVLESGWLARAPGNNPFGIKAAAAQAAVEKSTVEFVTPAQLARLQRAGRQIVSVGPLSGGRHKIGLRERFAAFDTLEAAFASYGRLLTAGRNFRHRLKRYQQHRQLSRLLADLMGADGQPPYATDPAYDTKLLQLIGQANVKAALAMARQRKAA